MYYAKSRSTAPSKDGQVAMMPSQIAVMPAVASLQLAMQQAEYRYRPKAFTFVI